LRYLTAGESHGKCLTAIIEGLPSGLFLKKEKIDAEFSRRQKGYGRSRRMSDKPDRVEILSGFRDGRTTGSPLTLQIANYSRMSAQDLREITAPRPGHADLPGILKYGLSDVRNILERASARETAARVAVGAVAKCLLSVFGVDIRSQVINIGGVAACRKAGTSAEFGRIESTGLRCADRFAEKKMIAAIDRAKARGDSVGGIFEIRVFGLPPGLGSPMHWDLKLDGLLAQAVMSIQAVKGVEIGMGFAAAACHGSEFHDEIYFSRGRGFFHRTNNTGGIEGGMSNGETVVIRGVMKPIPTLAKPIRTADIVSGKAVMAEIQRADICAVPSAGVVAESVVAWVLAEAMSEKFGGDSISEMERNFRTYIKGINIHGRCRGI